MNQFSTIGERLKSLRKSKESTLKDVSKSTGLSISYLSDIERDIVDPSLKTLIKLADVYETTVSLLLKDIV